VAGNHPDITILRPTPRPVQLPSGAPQWMRDWVQSQNEWCKAAQVAVQQLQSKVKTLEEVNEQSESN